MKKKTNIISKKKKTNGSYPFPSEKDLKEIREELSDPNYSQCSFALPKNADELDKIKYDICKMIIRYKREKKLPLVKIAQKIKLSEAETEDLLHYHINKFTIDRLVSYSNNLSIPLQIVETKKKLLRNVFTSKNGRLKHL